MLPHILTLPVHPVSTMVPPPNVARQAAKNGYAQLPTGIDSHDSDPALDTAPAFGSALKDSEPTAFLRCVLWCMTGARLGLDSANESQFMGAPHLDFGCASEGASGSLAQHLTDVLSFGCRSSTALRGSIALHNGQIVEETAGYHGADRTAQRWASAVVVPSDASETPRNPALTTGIIGSKAPYGDASAQSRPTDDRDQEGRSSPADSRLVAGTAAVAPVHVAEHGEHAGSTDRAGRPGRVAVALTPFYAAQATLQREHEAEALRRVSPEVWGALVAMTAGGMAA